MKKKFLMIMLAMGSLGFSQNVVDSVKVKQDSIVSIVDSEVKITTKVCGKNTSKNLPCKNKTKHESGSCHHHRD